MVVPLNDLLRGSQGTEVRWTEPNEKVLQNIKKALCGNSVLSTPDINQPFLLETDTSATALGVVLAQEVDGRSRPVAYAIHLLVCHETRYTTVQRKCLAIKWAIELFRYYLLGREFTLITDHNSLRWMQLNKTDNAHITRWAL